MHRKTRSCPFTIHPSPACNMAEDIRCFILPSASTKLKLGGYICCIESYQMFFQIRRARYSRSNIEIDTSQYLQKLGLSSVSIGISKSKGAVQKHFLYDN